MLPAVGLAIEEMGGAEALGPEIMSLAEFATEAEDGGFHVPLRSGWLDSFDYELAASTLTVNMQDGGSYTYPGTSIATALASPMHHRREVFTTETSNSAAKVAVRQEHRPVAANFVSTAFERGEP